VSWKRDDQTGKSVKVETVYPVGHICGRHRYRKTSEKHAAKNHKMNGAEYIVRP
jgi:hypothetical protein